MFIFAECFVRYDDGEYPVSALKYFPKKERFEKLRP